MITAQIHEARIEDRTECPSINAVNMPLQRIATRLDQDVISYHVSALDKHMGGPFAPNFYLISRVTQ